MKLVVGELSLLKVALICWLRSLSRHLVFVDIALLVVSNDVFRWTEMNMNFGLFHTILINVYALTKFVFRLKGWFWDLNLNLAL